MRESSLTAENKSKNKFGIMPFYVAKFTILADYRKYPYALPGVCIYKYVCVCMHTQQCIYLYVIHAMNEQRRERAKEQNGID